MKNNFGTTVEVDIVENLDYLTLAVVRDHRRVLTSECFYDHENESITQVFI